MKSTLRNSLLTVAMVACSALAVTFFSGCSKPEEPKTNIKVGAILAETGGASFLGGPEARTIRMMVEQINAGGGINGQQIELIVKDSAASPDKAISFAKQLIEEEKVIAILGPSTSGESLKLKSICEKAEVILLSCGAAEAIVNPVAKWVFKTPQTDSFAAGIGWTATSIVEASVVSLAILLLRRRGYRLTSVRSAYINQSMSN